MNVKFVRQDPVTGRITIDLRKAFLAQAQSVEVWFDENQGRVEVMLHKRPPGKPRGVGKDRGFGPDKPTRQRQW